MEQRKLSSGFELQTRAPAQAESMALVPEHNLPGLVHAHHVAPGAAPGHSVDSRAEERDEQALERCQDPGLHLALSFITGPRQFEALSEPIAYL